MVRKFFAVLILLLFVSVSPVLLVTQSLFSSFANEQFIVNNVIPESYNYEIQLLAENFSNGKSADIPLFERRLTQLLPRETYLELSGTFVKVVFASLEEWKSASKTGSAALEIDLTDIRKRFANAIIDRVKYLEECLPDEPMDSFRLCKPAVYAAEIDFGRLSADELEKNIPHTIVIFNKDNTRAQKVFGAILLVRDYLPLVLMAFAFLFAVFMVVLLLPKWHSVLKWTGSGFAIVGGLTGLFLMIISKFRDQFISIQESITKSEINIYHFLLDQPVSVITPWIFFIFTAAVLLFGFGIILKKHKKA